MGLPTTRAGRSPTFQDPGTPLDGLAGTRVPASPIEQVSSFKTSLQESNKVDLVPGYPLKLYQRLPHHAFIWP